MKKVVVMPVGDFNNPSSYAVVSSYEILEMGFNTISQAKEWAMDQGYVLEKHIFAEEELVKVKEIAHAWQHYCEDQLKGAQRRAIKVTDEHRPNDIELFTFWYETRFGNTPAIFPLTLVKEHLGFLSDFSYEALGAMEMQAVANQTAEGYIYGELDIIGRGRTIHEQITWVLDEKLYEFTLELNEAYAKRPKHDQWLSPGRIFTAVRSYNDCGDVH